MRCGNAGRHSRKRKCFVYSSTLQRDRLCYSEGLLSLLLLSAKRPKPFNVNCHPFRVQPSALELESYGLCTHLADISFRQVKRKRRRSDQKGPKFTFTANCLRDPPQDLTNQPASVSLTLQLLGQTEPDADGLEKRKDLRNGKAVVVVCLRDKPQIERQQVDA